MIQVQVWTLVGNEYHLSVEWREIGYAKGKMLKSGMVEKKKDSRANLGFPSMRSECNK